MSRKPFPKARQISTVKDVRKRLQEIQKFVGEHDDELAHSREDTLYEDLLESISRGLVENIDLIPVTREALKARLIFFARYCA